MSNLLLHEPYEGPDDIQIGDGLGLKITHVGLVFFSHSFNLSNVLCVPSINQNLIYVSKFCHSNQTSIEFFPTYFVVKDLNSRTPLLRRKNRHDLYEWSILADANKSPVMTFSASLRIKASFMVWHGLLCHPSLKILKSLIQFGLVPLLPPISPHFMCESCLCSKSQHFPFGESTLESRGPLDLIYTNV